MYPIINQNKSSVHSFLRNLSGKLSDFIRHYKRLIGVVHPGGGGGGGGVGVFWGGGGGRRGGGGGGGGTLGDSLVGVRWVAGATNSDPISDQTIHTRFQTWPLKSIRVFGPGL